VSSFQAIAFMCWPLLTETLFPPVRLPEQAVKHITAESHPARDILIKVRFATMPVIHESSHVYPLNCIIISVGTASA